MEGSGFNSAMSYYFPSFFRYFMKFVTAVKSAVEWNPAVKKIMVYRTHGLYDPTSLGYIISNRVSSDMELVDRYGLEDGSGIPVAASFGDHKFGEDTNCVDATKFYEDGCNSLGEGIRSYFPYDVYDLCASLLDGIDDDDTEFVVEVEYTDEHWCSRRTFAVPAKTCLPIAGDDLAFIPGCPARFHSNQIAKSSGLRPMSNVRLVTIGFQADILPVFVANVYQKKAEIEESSRPEEERVVFRGLSDEDRIKAVEYLARCDIWYSVIDKECKNIGPALAACFRDVLLHVVHGWLEQLHVYYGGFREGEIMVIDTQIRFRHPMHSDPITVDHRLAADRLCLY